jgi:hypothetical protein
LIAQLSQRRLSAAVGDGKRENMSKMPAQKEGDKWHQDGSTACLFAARLRIWKLAPNPVGAFAAALPGDERR